MIPVDYQVEILDELSKLMQEVISNKKDNEFNNNINLNYKCPEHGGRWTCDDKIDKDKYTLKDLNFSEDGDAGYGGEWHGTISAKDPKTGKIIGYVDYSYLHGDYRIEMIETDKDHQRKGVAKALIDKLTENFKEGDSLEVAGDFATEDGQAFLNSIDMFKYARGKIPIKEVVTDSSIDKPVKYDNGIITIRDKLSINDKDEIIKELSRSILDSVNSKRIEEYAESGTDPNDESAYEIEQLTVDMIDDGHGGFKRLFAFGNDDIEKAKIDVLSRYAVDPNKMFSENDSIASWAHDVYNDANVEPSVMMKQIDNIIKDNSEEKLNSTYDGSVKLNYKCKKEESPDGNSNKCINKEDKLENGDLADKSIVSGIDKINKLGLKNAISKISITEPSGSQLISKGTRRPNDLEIKTVSKVINTIPSELLKWANDLDIRKTGLEVVVTSPEYESSPNHGWTSHAMINRVYLQQDVFEGNDPEHPYGEGTIKHELIHALVGSKIDSYIPGGGKSVLTKENIRMPIHAYDSSHDGGSIDEFYTMVMEQYKGNGKFNDDELAKIEVEKELGKGKWGDYLHSSKWTPEELSKVKNIVLKWTNDKRMLNAFLDNERKLQKWEEEDASLQQQEENDEQQSVISGYIQNDNKLINRSFQEISSTFNSELGGFHTTDYKTSKDKSLRVISQDKNDNSKLLESIKDIPVEQLPRQFMVMKMINDVPAKYYAKTGSIGVNKKLSSEEMKVEIEKVLNSMKHNAFDKFIEYVTPENEIKMNYRCKKGTVDDTFKCEPDTSMSLCYL